MSKYVEVDNLREWLINDKAIGTGQKKKGESLASFFYRISKNYNLGVSQEKINKLNQWNNNRLVNPYTDRKIIENGPTYQDLEMEYNSIYNSDHIRQILNIRQNREIFDQSLSLLKNNANSLPLYYDYKYNNVLSLSILSSISVVRFKLNIKKLPTTIIPLIESIEKISSPYPNFISDAESRCNYIS